MSTKKEYRISSEDSARPAATLADSPQYHSDIKPKERHVVDVIYEETDEVVQAKTGEPVKMILRTTIYSDGAFAETTVGEHNEAYKEFLRTGISVPQSKSNKPTGREQSKKVKDALAKVNKKTTPKE